MVPFLKGINIIHSTEDHKECPKNVSLFEGNKFLHTVKSGFKKHLDDQILSPKLFFLAAMSHVNNIRSLCRNKNI